MDDVLERAQETGNNLQLQQKIHAAGMLSQEENNDPSPWGCATGSEHQCCPEVHSHGLGAPQHSTLPLSCPGPSPRCRVVGGDGSSNDQKQVKPTVVCLVEEGRLVQVPEAEAAQIKDVMQKKEETVFSS